MSCGVRGSGSGSGSRSGHGQGWVSRDDVETDGGDADEERDVEDDEESELEE